MKFSLAKNQVISHMRELAEATNESMLRDMHQVGINCLLRSWKGSYSEIYNVQLFSPEKAFFEKERRDLYKVVANEIVIILSGRIGIYKFLSQSFGSKLEIELHQAYAEAASLVETHFKEILSGT